MKIIDDDAYHFGQEENDDDIYALNEEAPQIVGIIDERAPNVLMKQEYLESGNWKVLASTSDKPQSHKETEKSKPKDENGSPARKKRKDSSDASPPRRSRKDSDASPPRRFRKDSDASPPRRKRNDSDESPPRKANRVNVKRERSRSRDNRNSRWSSTQIKKEASLSPPPTHRPHNSKMSKTLDGKTAGLQNAQALKRENDEFRQRQEKAYKRMGAEASGRNAEVVIRDRRGRNKELEFDADKERAKMEFEEERKKKYDRWSKGLKQQEDIDKRREEFVHEANKPLARFEDDDDLQNHLKDRELLDDPMLMYMRKKRMDIKISQGYKEKPQYKGEFPDNRFKIRPGYRWDGVDRSNGYEQKYFMALNSKKSMEEEAYRYSTEDM